MSEEKLPTKSDTPADHEVVVLTVEAALLPEWFEIIKEVSAPHARRMAVLEKPDEWVVRVELPKASRASWGQELTEAWQKFAAKQRELGNWD
ncbi:MAG: hypothetical protein HN348_32670 [Proteobacteria bacterium]|jgi:hypothetical protein|nr:hypothetical protein [Pseudomonadota bacterium]